MFNNVLNYLTSNKLVSSYHVDKEPSCYGNELRWKLYNAERQKSSTSGSAAGGPVGDDTSLTVFLFEKKTLDTRQYPKDYRDQILASLHREATALQRLRHPNILSVIDPLSDERQTMAFVTRRVTQTLGTVLATDRKQLSLIEVQTGNIDFGGLREIGSDLDVRGLLDIASALEFLHHASTCHLGLCPSAIFLTPNGRWVLGGLAYSQSPVEPGRMVPCQVKFRGIGGMAGGMILNEPSIRYAAPEMTTGYSSTCGQCSDVFSFGLIAYELFSKGRQPLLSRVTPGADPTAHQRETQNALPLREGDPQISNSMLFALLQSMTQPDPTRRCTIETFLNSEYFNDINIKALRFLETLSEKDDAARTAFLRGRSGFVDGSFESSDRIPDLVVAGLPRLLSDRTSPLVASPQLIRERILPPLADVALSFSALWPSALPCLLMALKYDGVCDPQYFQARIWPRIRPLFSAKEISVECVTILIRNLDLFIHNTTAKDASDVLVPFVLRCIELKEDTIIQEVFTRLPLLQRRFEYTTLQHVLLPRMLKMMTDASEGVPTRIRCLIINCMQEMLPVLDNTTMVGPLLKALTEATTTDSSSQVDDRNCMGALRVVAALGEIYEKISENLGAKLTATKVLPCVAPLMANEDLTFEQWNRINGIVTGMVDRVVSWREKDYRHRTDAGREASAALGASAPPPPPSMGSRKSTSSAASAPVDFDTLLMGGAPSEPSRPSRAAPPPPPQQQPRRPADEFPFAAPSKPKSTKKNTRVAPPSSTSSFTSTSSRGVVQNDLLDAAPAKSTSVDLLGGGSEDFFAPAPVQPSQGSQLATFDLTSLYSQNPSASKPGMSANTEMSLFVAASSNGSNKSASGCPPWVEKTGADPKRFGVRNLGNEDPFAGLM
ncbi:SCY1-like protein 2 [Perkinsus olseni]|uniref:SCY1-like protein 2 n=1 Tax=Perkinsus olseni TaxID=32597 RepID=A0A7J6PQ08_PEROL|nr:SCY1-like protein 2 [Perkinsus olseni]